MSILLLSFRNFCLSRVLSKQHCINLSLVIAAVILYNSAYSQLKSVKTVFIIVMSDQPLSGIIGNSNAPYINNTILPIASLARNYFSHPGNNILSNYLFLEAGDDFGATILSTSTNFHISNTNHLTTQLANAGVSWKSYQEGINGATCPMANAANYNSKFNPFIFFDDITNNHSSTSALCISHIRPLAELNTDLATNMVARYNFIKPNICNSMYRGCSTVTNHVHQGDDWLSQIVPLVLNSAAYKDGGAIFITWDQGDVNSPVGMILLSPFAKHGYANSVSYTHSSTLRTFQEIFGLTNLLGDAANQTPLDDFFLVPGGNEATSTLSWTASPGATSYTVKRATNGSGPFTTIATGIATTSYIDKNVIGGTTYFYVVTAVNRSGESPPSAQVSATPVAIPPAPTNLIVQ